MHRENRGWQWLSHIIMVVISMACLFPFALLVMASFTDEQEIIRDGYSFFPGRFSVDAYLYLGNKIGEIAHAYGITLLITVVGTVVGVAVTAMLAYPLSKPDMPYRNLAAFLIFFTLLFNGGLVPTYLIYTQVLGIKNTIWALIVPGLLANGFNVLLMRSYFSTAIPAAVIESANIDGAGEFRTFHSIVIPLSTPILATVGLFQLVLYWNDWFNGMVYITDSRFYSLQNLLNRILTDIQFLTSSNVRSSVSAGPMPSETVRMAIAVIGVVPLLAAYPFFQRFFVKGLVVGAVKG
ncbi:carbohydrate ABC transporter permease [Paenibacillus sp. S150]|uniref:carbohydrate ABC transporter permease n=1 Tax=Paenibacillus sp. S150 TaxID=2749826 RepID=UPI001C56A7D6|nr:carbohydrate ABC transporter permease [Paenibacillus sp. S150]MBW4082522.1 carbohydrate ABC transporter permease [Paenibacillus sp. S150]